MDGQRKRALAAIFWIPLAAAAPNPAALTRGKVLYNANCGFCHGADARGGEGGPNLRGAQQVATVVQSGRPERGMPKFTLTAAQVSDIEAYILNFAVDSRSILAGDARAGEAYFSSRCSSCHSVTGDLKGIASRIGDPKTLQNTFVMPAHASPATVTVTLPSDKKIEGRLAHIDDFTVSLVESDGVEQTFNRDGDQPRVEIHDPLKPHKDLLRSYTDRDIHNVTAYLATLK